MYSVLSKNCVKETGMAACQNALPTEIIGFARQKETIDLPSKFPWSPESARQMQANFSTGRVERSREERPGKISTSRHRWHASSCQEFSEYTRATRRRQLSLLFTLTRSLRVLCTPRGRWIAINRSIVNLRNAVRDNESPREPE